MDGLEHILENFNRVCFSMNSTVRVTPRTLNLRITSRSFRVIQTQMNIQLWRGKI